MIDLLFSGTRGSMLPTWLCGFPFLRPLPSCQAGGGNGICHETPFWMAVVGDSEPLRIEGYDKKAWLFLSSIQALLSVLMGLGPASPRHGPLLCREPKDCQQRVW